MIHELLTTGRENPKSGKELASLLGIPIRRVTLQIAKERQQGQPICASNAGRHHGYYLAADKAEMERYCRSLYHRAGEIHRARNACKALIETLPDPEEPAPQATDN